MSATASILLACVVSGLALAAPIISWLRARRLRQQRAMRRASADIARERMGVRLDGERQWRDGFRRDTFRRDSFTRGDSWGDE